MSEYLVLLPQREDAFDELSETEQTEAMEYHAQLWRDLGAGGHEVITASPLAHSKEALTIRCLGQGEISVTDGPFTEAVEQIAGSYLIKSDDYDDLVRCCEALARGDNHIELRKLNRG